MFDNKCAFWLFWVHSECNWLNCVVAFWYSRDGCFLSCGLMEGTVEIYIAFRLQVMIMFVKCFYLNKWTYSSYLQLRVLSELFNYRVNWIVLEKVINVLKQLVFLSIDKHFFRAKVVLYSTVTKSFASLCFTASPSYKSTQYVCDRRVAV